MPAIFLRLGFAFVFIYAAIGAFREPLAWSSYIPDFATEQIAANTLLHIFSVSQLLLALWFLIGKYVRFAALVAAVMLLSVVAANPTTLVVTFRDIGLACAAFALAFIEE